MKEKLKAYWRNKKERREAILERRRNTAFAKKMAPIYKVMNQFSLLLHFLYAILINFVIEMISRHSIVEAWNYMVVSPLTFLFNVYLIFSTFLLVYLFRRRVFMRILITVLWLAIGITNGYMLSMRVTPFNAQDLKMVGDVTTMLDKYFSGIEGALLIIGILAVLVWVYSMWRRGGQYQGKIHYIPTIIIIIAVFSTFGLVTDAAIQNRILSNYFGNIAFAYQDYGLPYCFSSSLFDTGIDQPNGYSEAVIDELVEESNLREINASMEEYPNIIFIQLESFFDPYELEFLQMSEDPIPNFRKLMKNYSSGYFKVPSVGAGTANTEFEVLTGMNLRYFGPGEYPYKTLLKYEPVESVASALAEFGYGTHALHNNGGGFYSRADVFNHMGFDSYTSKEFMNILQLTENGWAKDDILTEHILNAMDSTEQQDFVFCITVQGHGDYPEYKVIENPKITVSGCETEGENYAWEYFVNHLYETDQFIGDLLEELEKRGEPTVLMMYGDHLPTMGLEATDLKSRYLYNTNYVIWDNIGLKKKDGNVTTYQITSTVFEQLGIHSGTVFNYHQKRHQTKDYLLDLELLQYDLLYGKQYAYEQGETSPLKEGHMQMGILDVVIQDIELQPDGSYHLYAENMTQNSRIFVNGTRVSSEFVNDNLMKLKSNTLEDGDVVVVSQVGAASRIFRTSEEFIYEDLTVDDESENADIEKEELEEDSGE